MQFKIGPDTISLTVPDKAALLTKVAQRLDTRCGFALATMNVDHLEKLPKDARFRAAYQAHDLIVADGNPVVWLARLGGQQVSLVPGSELVVPLCRLAAEAGVGVAIIAGTEQAARDGASELQRMIPGLSVVLTTAPGFPFDPDGPEGDELLDQLSASGAGLCLLAVGAPRQEVFAARACRALPSVGFASVGAGIDFIAGRQRRAPVLVRRARLEWAWRAALSPLRLGPRYARGALILPGHAYRTFLARRSRG
ncbi:WecB/TagA/CpsF family glycosyltransferase [Paracoccus zeaxanthinifaciens]|uniref:WecB/TagA/CpsF family glycosyltransferase n=1 Tax=Paracoccus zeaxanthinifaciens TaxID=187400 RepID=UPI0003B33908|nr:WecB/TagA/CpsF family glycosyltransferase [Paracoccus zeaxanthinifaciens]